MNVHDDEFLESIAVLALGALPEDEARSLVAHLSTCATCRAEYAALRTAADFVGYGAELGAAERDDVAARRLKSRVMRAVRSESTAARPSRNGSIAPVRGRTPWLAYGGAVAAAIVATFAVADDVSQRSTNGASAARVATLERNVAVQTSRASDADARARALDARIAQLVAPGSKHFAVARGEVIASGGRVIVALRGLPTLPKGKVYQAWTLAHGAKIAAPSITFSPDARGVAIVELPEAATNLSAVAVSVEPDGGSKKPTSKPTFVRALS